jgi:hypothetical protein
MTTLNSLIDWFITLINNTLVPLIFSLAFLLFLFGVFKYFFGSGDKAAASRKEGQQYILWAVIAFAVMLSVWGLVSIVTNTIPGLSNQNRPCIPTFGNANCAPGTGTQSAPAPSPAQPGR